MFYPDIFLWVEHKQICFFLIFIFIIFFYTFQVSVGKTENTASHFPGSGSSISIKFETLFLNLFF